MALTHISSSAPDHTISLTHHPLNLAVNRNFAGSLGPDREEVALVINLDGIYGYVYLVCGDFCT